jgi:spore coat polysaccharide biosynthesis protein SpsF (cytidylyltransferase family)
MIVGIIQARMGSTRLAGKVLLPIGELTLLEHCYNRLQHSTKVDRWILATTTEPADDVIETFCKEYNISCYRGSEWDVLDRFYQAIQHFNLTPTTVVRICCDNPTHHGEVVDFAIREFQRYQVDYFSNGNQPPTYSQDGITSEVFSYNALEKAWKESTMLSEREHVTPYIKTSGLFKCAWRKFSDNYQFKLSVDTPADLELSKRVFQELGNDFTIEELIVFLTKNKNLLSINEESIINEGYQKSLKEDRKVK